MYDACEERDTVVHLKGSIIFQLLSHAFLLPSFSFYETRNSLLDLMRIEEGGRCLSSEIGEPVCPP